MKLRFAFISGLLWTMAVVAVQADDADQSAGNGRAEGDPPRFEQRMSDETYAKRSAEFVTARDELRKLAETQHPAEGVVVSHVLPDGAAEENRIEIGDLVHTMGDHRLWISEPVWSSLDEEKRRKVVYYDRSADRMKSFQVDGYYLGVNYAEYWNPGLSYLRDEAARGKWDDHLLNACLCRETDPEFAEAALFRAEREGSPRSLHVIQLGMIVSLMQNLPERAAAFLNLLDWSNEDDAQKYHPIVSLRTAFANNDLKSVRLIEAVSPTSTQTSGERLPAMLEYIQRRDRQLGKEPLEIPPSEAASSYFRDNLLPHCQARTRASLYGFLKAIRGGEPYHDSLTPGHYVYMVIGTDYPVNDFEYRLKFTLKPNGTEWNRWQKCLKIGLAEDQVIYPELEHSQTYKTVMIRVAEMVKDPEQRAFIDISTSGGMVGLRYVDSSIKLDGQQEIDLHVLRVRDMLEVQLNGNRVYWVPLTSTASLNPSLQPIGVDMHIKSLTFDELIPQAER